MDEHIVAGSRAYVSDRLHGDYRLYFVQLSKDVFSGGENTNKRNKKKKRASDDSERNWKKNT